MINMFKNIKETMFSGLKENMRIVTSQLNIQCKWRIGHYKKKK